MKIKNNVLVITPSFTPSLIVAVLPILNYLKNKEFIEFSILSSDKVTEKHIEKIDVLICVRGFSKRELEIVELCNKQSKYVIYFIDDDLISFYSSRGIENYIASIIKKANHLWTPSINIKKKYRNLLRKISVIDEPALILDENKIITHKEEKDKIFIGFAGNPFYRYYISKFLDKPISIISQKYKDKIKIEFLGIMPLEKTKYEVEYIPYNKDYNQYMKIMKSRNWDIGVVPLEASEFYSCKYFLKFLDYGAIGAAGIYSNIEPYTHIVINMENGILVNNTCDEWVKALEYLIENPEERLKIQKKAYNQLKSKFNVSYISRRVMEKIPQIIECKAPNNRK